jgi:hypothetical protein
LWALPDLSADPDELVVGHELVHGDERERSVVHEQRDIGRELHRGIAMLKSHGLEGVGLEDGDGEE